MASTSVLPTGGISLRGAANFQPDSTKLGWASAILLKLDHDLLQDLKRASNGKDAPLFVTGKLPKLRLGSRTLDLNLAPDTAPHSELFASTNGSSVADLTFARSVSHRAEVKPEHTSNTLVDDTSGTDTALDALKNSLASLDEEKKAKQANITQSVLPTPKNRFDAARKEKQERRAGLLGSAHPSQEASPSFGATATARPGLPPTSIPASEDDVRLKAMRTPTLHLLAVKPATTDEIQSKTHIPKEDLEAILQKMAKQTGGKWVLTDRSYRDLDVWKFKYPAQSDRQAAVDNAVKAYDRMRLARDDKLWQTLLPLGDRYKGILLSKLHQVNNRGLTPHHQSSSLPVSSDSGATGDGSKTTNSANTPRLGATPPRTVSSKADIKKRLLTKDPKARAVEQAKERKRKEREAAPSDRENTRPTKKQATKRTNPNVKSAEFVYSSDEASEGEIVETSPRPHAEKAKDVSKPGPKAKPKQTTSPNSSSSTDMPIKKRKEAAAAQKSSKAKPTPDAKPAAPLKPRPQTAQGKTTPQTSSSQNLSAPQGSSHQHSPSTKTGSTRPSVPSPLGAARPRVASDVSDQGAVGVQKVRQGGGADPPGKGLGITNGASTGMRKRQDTLTGRAEVLEPVEKTKERDKPAANAAPAASKNVSSTNGVKQHTNGINGTNGTLKNRPDNTSSTNGTNSTLKTKPDNISSFNTTSKPNDPAKSHRKAPSSASSASSSSFSTTNHAPSSTASSSLDPAAALCTSISYTQGIAQAEQFAEKYYPAYAQLYDELEAKLARGEAPSADEKARLWAMHHRLLQMKREIILASKREGIAVEGAS